MTMTVWEELAYYEENTRDFLFPEPKLTPSHPGIHRELLMKTAIGFPGIAPKLEFSTRTAIRECMFLHRNRFHEEKYKTRMPLSTSRGPVFPLNDIKIKPKENSPDRLPRGLQPRTPSPYSTRRFFLEKPAQSNLGNNFKLSGEGKPPFVVRHVDSTKPFGENTSEHYSQKSKRKSKFSNFPFTMRRGIQVSCYTCTYSYENQYILLIFFHFEESQVTLDTVGLIIKDSPSGMFPEDVPMGLRHLRLQAINWTVPLQLKGMVLSIVAHQVLQFFPSRAGKAENSLSWCELLAKAPLTANKKTILFAISLSGKEQTDSDQEI
ncbi:Spermatogenesis associated 6-like protein [Sciurus carolinensis]|uniref:Spermatogenesis associated 6-like protein n=1 Tax=Sciurus carolinensis TaxID=30640 RepID=A0AA41SQC7_SCICA|nr:Spermatogenesis associated 6-like protein [Sciurus carolinensis]